MLDVLIGGLINFLEKMQSEMQGSHYLSNQKVFLSFICV